MKDDFPLLKNNPDLVYLDSAATTQKPRAVIDAIRNFYEEQNANPGRALYNLGYEATELHENCRKTVADFLNANPEQVIFTSGATGSLNLAALSFAEKLKPGDEIVISILEHHSNLLPWQKLAEKTGAKLKIAKPSLASLSNIHQQILTAFSAQITEKTKLVALSAASNILGIKLPVKEIAKLAHEVGAEVICDAAQLVAHERLDVKKLDVDFIAFSGHKMYAPMGVGVLYVKNPDDFTPVFFGGGAISSVSENNTALADDISRFEPGTRNLEGELGLKTAIEYIKNKNINNNLAKKLYDSLKDNKDFEVYGSPDVPIIAFNLKNLHPHDVATLLAERSICLRAGFHCAEPLMHFLNLNGGCLRASFGVYNDENDVKKLLSALEEIKGILS